MAEPGFIVPPPGLLPEPAKPAAEPDAPTPAPERVPAFFPVAPGRPSRQADDEPASPTIAPQPAPTREQKGEEQRDAAPSAPEPTGSAPAVADTPAQPGERAQERTAEWLLETGAASPVRLPAALVIGRAPVAREGEQTLVVTGGGTVSKTHARIRNERGDVTIEDLGSTNGTAVLVGGQRVLLEPRVPFALTADAELLVADARVKLRRA